MANENEITKHCCSVDDLRSYLKTMRPETDEAKKETLKQLSRSIVMERLDQNRVTIINMLEAKGRQIKKSIAHENRN